MPYLVNPFGRIVAIDDLKQYENLLATKNFTKANDDQIREWQEKRATLVEKQKVGEKGPADTGVYMATVSQGGTDGYAIASAAMMKSLRDLGINISTHNTGQKVALIFHNPYSVLSINSPYRIIYTMFESDKIPDDWASYLKAADLVIVPSKWCQNVFKNSGIDTKVVPLGYDDDVFTFKPRHSKQKTRETFTFLHYNAFNIRKGFPEVFKAFVKAFDKTEPVKMIFKTTVHRPPLPITKEMYPNIEVLTGQTTAEELASLCHRSDCFVFPSRGEGFGITPLEAMATGIPAIVPNAHGITEYFNAQFMYEVEVKEMCPALYQRYKGQDVGKMVVCDVDDLANKMRWIYDHQDEAIERGRMASIYVKQWTFKKTAEKMKEILLEALKTPVAKDKKSEDTLDLDPI